MVEVVCVDPKRIDEIWPHVASLVRRAYERQRCLDDFETIKPKLDMGRCLLWLAWDEEILGVAVTELWGKPSGKICAILACAGKQMKRWIHCLAAIERFAKNEGCYLIYFEGRHGWRRFMPDYKSRIILEKRL